MTPSHFGPSSPFLLLGLLAPLAACDSSERDGTGASGPGANATQVAASGPTGGADATTTGPGSTGAATSGGGALVDDAPYVLRGEGFGENAVADQLWMGGKHGTIESAAVGHDLNQDPRWFEDTAGNGDTQITDVAAWSHDKALMADSATAPEGSDGSGPWQGIFSAAYDTGAPFSRVTLSYKVRWEDQSAALGQPPLAQMQWKMVRLCYGPFVSDGESPNMLLSNWMGQATLSRNSGDGETSWLDHEAMPRIDGGWYAVELEVRVNQPLDAANGRFSVRVRRAMDGVVTLDTSESDVVFIDADDPNGFFQWIVFQNYQGNLNQGTEQPEPVTNPSRVFLDDVYAITDGAGAHVVLGDAPTWSAVTREEVQPFSSWSDDAIEIPHLNQGAFADLGAKYLYVKTSPSTVTRENGYPLE